MIRRACDFCGKEYEALRPNSRYCGAACRQRKRRDPSAAAVATLPATETSTSTLADVVRRDLEDAGRLETVPGQLAVALAERLASAGTTASSLATLSKELRALMAEALMGRKPRERNALDELKARREARAASA